MVYPGVISSQVSFSLISSPVSRPQLHHASSSLLVQLVRPLLQLLLARWLAQVLGDDRARVGLVVLERGGASARGLVVGAVERVRGGVGLARLLRDLVGQVCSRVD